MRLRYMENCNEKKTVHTFIRLLQLPVFDRIYSLPDYGSSWKLTALFFELQNLNTTNHHHCFIIKLLIIEITRAVEKWKTNKEQNKDQELPEEENIYPEDVSPIY